MNESGIRPMGYQVLVKPDIVEEVSQGGIILAPKEVEREQFAKEEGTFIEGGSIAFTNPLWKAIPAPGLKVLYKKYAGIEVKRDGTTYRLMPDEEIGAVLED